MKNSSKYHDLIQQDFRVEHLILYFKYSDAEYEKKIGDIYHGLNSVKNKYVLKNNANRRANFDIYFEILNNPTITDEDSLFILEKQANYNSLILELKEIIFEFNISEDSSYIDKTGFNTRKNGYLKIFTNALLDYYYEEGQVSNLNKPNYLIHLLKKFIIEFKSYDNLVTLYRNENYVKQKSESVLKKSKSAFENIRKFVDTIS